MFWNRHKPSTPPPASIAVEPGITLIQAHRPRIQRIQSLVGITARHWNALYEPLLCDYAHFVQRLPASEAHHHATPGGMLRHGLEALEQGLRLRQTHLLPPDTAAEEIGEKRDRWTYAVATASLLHDIAKPFTDLSIALFDADARSLGLWNPWIGSMPREARWYRLSYRSSRDYRLHEHAAALLVHHIVPSFGRMWLSQDMEVFSAWSAILVGHPDKAGVLGQIVQQADQASVANDLAGAPQAPTPGIRKKPLATRLATGLREAIKNGAITLNRAGAKGWLIDDTLWLMSKGGLDALREHLQSEGQQGIPNNNVRLMDELQQHGVLSPNGDKAIWHGTVHLHDGWTSPQPFTLLKLEASAIWPDIDSRPRGIDGDVVLDAATEINDAVDAEPHVDPPAQSAIVPPRTSDRVIPFPVLAPGPASRATGTELRTDEENASEGLPAPPEPQYEPKTRYGEEPPEDAGERFLWWLHIELARGARPINTPEAQIHTVPEGLLLVSPAIFKSFAAAWDDVSYDHAQKRFQKLKINLKRPDSTNIWSYSVTGERKKGRTLKGMLIPDPDRVLEMALPAPNPALQMRDM